MEYARERTFVENFDHWSEYTALKSLRNVAAWRQIPCKVLWFALTIAALIAGIVNSYFIIKEFLQYNKDTNIQLKNTLGSTFPAVTVCNLNPIRLSAMEYAQELSDLQAVYKYLTSDAYQGSKDENAPASGDASDYNIQIPANGTDFGLKSRRKREADGEETATGVLSQNRSLDFVANRSHPPAVPRFLGEAEEIRELGRPKSIAVDLDPPDHGLLSRVKRNFHFNVHSGNDDINEHGCHECADDVRFEPLNDDHSSAVFIHRHNHVDARNNDDEQHSGSNNHDHGVEQHELEHNGEQQHGGHNAEHASFELDRPVDHSGNHDEHEYAVHNNPFNDERIDEHQQHDNNNEHNADDDDDNECPHDFDEHSSNDAHFHFVVHEHAADDELVHPPVQHAAEFNEHPADLNIDEHFDSIELDGRKFQPPVNGGELDAEQQHAAFEHSAHFLLLLFADDPAKDSSARTSSPAASTSTPRISSSFPPTSARPNATSGAPSTPTGSPTSPPPTTQQPTRPPFDFSKLPIPESTANYSIAKLNSLISYFGLNASSNRVALESQVQDRMQQIIADMDPNTREALGYKLRDLVISCAFNQIPCDYDTDFQTITDPDYGNCYTYNYNGVHKTARSGTQYGLRLITFSNISDYLYSSSQAGVRVTLSKQNFAVFPNTYGYSVSVGSYVAVPVQYNHIKRLGHPYNQCTKEDDTNGQIYNGSYTYEGCLRSCFQEKMVERCGCADSRFPKSSPSQVYCGPTNETAFLCYQKSITGDGDYTAAANCSCFSPCTDPEYSAQLTTAAWPVFFENFTSAQCYQYYPGTTVDCYTAYSGNAVSIDVFYADGVYETTTETPNMSGWDLFRNLAGAVSLWIGASLLTIFELIELLLFVCLSNGCCPKKRVGAPNFDPYAVPFGADDSFPPPVHGTDGMNGGFGMDGDSNGYGAGGYVPIEGGGQAQRVPARFVSD
ncbi:hypothetical protein M3Y99_00141400 [Aphelenchoides fujianensis]|nr:hypothetical protein M3Y99_00141400 [Aphelenchoides fujianensis]